MSRATAGAGDSLLAGKLVFGDETFALAGLDFVSVGTDGPLAEHLQGFSWLRDLAAAASREKGSRLVEAIVGRWLLAHGTRVDGAWRPDLWGERILFWTAYAPYILSSTDSGYRSALLNTLARGARHLEAHSDRAPAGLARVTAWAGAVAASLAGPGRGRPDRPKRIRAGPCARLRAIGRRRPHQPDPLRAGPVRRSARPASLCLFRRQASAARKPGGRFGGGPVGPSRGHPGRRRPVELAGRQCPGPGADHRHRRGLRDAGAGASGAARLGLPPFVGARHHRRHGRRAASSPKSSALRAAHRHWRSSCPTARSG
jgi:hypothetical protein